MQSAALISLTIILMLKLTSATDESGVHRTNHRLKQESARLLRKGGEDASQNYIRGCYFTNWAQYRPGNGKYMPENYQSGLCQYIFYAFGKLNADFTVETFKRMAATSANRAKFISSLVSFLTQNKFDGFDLDWEYPERSDKQNYVLLCQEILAKFQQLAKSTGGSRLLFTSAVSANPETVDAGFDVPALAKVFDFINLMSYDYHGAWETQTGINSPLFPRKEDSSQFKLWNIQASSKYWNDKGMPKEKIIIGLATYGRGWTLKDAAKTAVGAPASGPSTTTEYLREAGVISYYEINWIKQEKYGGAFVWTLDYDDFLGTFCPQNNGEKYPLISLMQKMLGDGYVPPPTASTTTAVTPASTTPPATTTTSPAGPFQCPSDGLFPDPQSCSNYYQCSGGIAFKMNCPTGLMFNPKTSTCDYASNVDCQVKNNTV